MPVRRNRGSHSLVRQTADLAVAVPQVVAHRVTRMAAAGPNPSRRDQREFYLMGSEKIWAFYESWFAMAQGLARAYQQAWLGAFQSMLGPSSMAPGARLAGPLEFQRIALGVLGKGLVPVRRRAVRNANRLKRARRR